MQKRKIALIIVGVVVVIMIVILSIFLYYRSVLKGALDDLTTVENAESIFSVYVLQNDPAEGLQDTKGYTYGYTKQNADKEYISQAINEVKKQIGEDISVTEYENLFTLIDALKDGKSKAILFREAYLESVQEVQGYEWTKTGVRKLASFTFEEEEKEEMTVPQRTPTAFVAYISGIDTYGSITARSRSDVNILAVVNTETKELLLLSTPRDFYVDFSVTGGQKDKLTHAGIYGVEASIDALERLYEIDIDYYLRMNFTGFVQIVDALGGVEVYSDYDFTVKNIKTYKKGYNKVNGIEALAFARERYSFSNGDYQRAKNQIEVIRAVLNKAMSPALLLNFAAVMDAVSNSVETNMPKEQVLSLVKTQITGADAWNIASHTTTGTSTYAPTYSMPGRNLYVIIPSEESVQTSIGMIKEVMEGTAVSSE